MMQATRCTVLGWVRFEEPFVKRLAKVSDLGPRDGGYLGVKTSLLADVTP